MEFRLPELDGTEEEAEIVAWVVQDGSRVQGGQTVLEITFEKANVEISAPVAGTIRDLSVSPGDIVEPGDLLAVIEEDAG